MAKTTDTSFAYIIHSDTHAEKTTLTAHHKLVEDSFLWCHIDVNEKNAYQWLLKKSNVNPEALSMLTTLESRSRMTLSKKGMFALFYTGLAEDKAFNKELIPVSIWIETDRVLTVAAHPLEVIQTVIDRFKTEEFPTNCVDFIQLFIDAMVDESYAHVEQVAHSVDAIEQSVDAADTYLYRNKIIDVRKQVISLRRYLLPQKETVQRFCSQQLQGATDISRQQINMSAEQIMHQLELLTSIYERARVMQEELSNQLSEQLNQKMYLLSAITCVFLPLSFITGLLGINVEGIPGSHNKWAFLLVCVSLVAIGFITLMFFKRNRWL